MWNKKVHDFGNITSGQTLVAEFIYGGPDTIDRITASCGCTLVSNKDNKVKVSFTPSKKSKDVYIATKHLKVFMKNNNGEAYQEQLKITAKIYRNNELIPS